jgi:hypothetical protein
MGRVAGLLAALAVGGRVRGNADRTDQAGRRPPGDVREVSSGRDDGGRGAEGPGIAGQHRRVGRLGDLDVLGPDG